MPILPTLCLTDLLTRVFPKLYKFSNVDNKGLRKEEQNKQKKKTPVGIEPKTSCDLLWCLANCVLSWLLVVSLNL